MKDKGFRCVVIGVPGSRRRIGRLDCHGLIASSFPDVLKAPLAGIKLDLLGSGPLLCVQDSDCLIGSVLAFKDSIFHFQIARKKRGASFVLPCDVSHRKTKAEAVCLRAHAGFRRAAVQDSSGSLLIETFKATVPRFKRDRRSQDPELPIPRENVGDIQSEPVPLWAVETGKNYALVISNTTGLWRYEIGDTIRFTSTKPYKFVITGRTKSYINAFGEELIVDNAERGLEMACQATGAEVCEYTAAPIFMDKQAKCRHQWLIEFSHMPDSVEHFAEVLDKSLQKLNSDYEAKRSKDITLQPLEIIVAKPNVFNDWLASEGKLGGQHKVPRLCNDRKIIEKVLALNN